jgi:hypothetical protein
MNIVLSRSDVAEFGIYKEEETQVFILGLKYRDGAEQRQLLQQLANAYTSSLRRSN